MVEDARDQAEFLAILAQARSEWLQAQNYFEIVSDPDLVDYAIYQLEAAKLKYMYLIKQARILGFENKQVIQEVPRQMFN
ncbi:MAG TPA: YaaL family protein [Clostridia bacterium]|nr:YaaL family protein [Clostridia bacterium]